MKPVSIRLIKNWLLALALWGGLPAWVANSTAQSTTVRPVAKVQTDPVPSRSDAADDPAVWIHPTDPGQSLVLGTDKKGGLHLYGMDGRQLQVVSPGTRPNNVDVLYNFPLGGAAIDLAVAGTRDPLHLGVKVWRIDPATRRLADVTAGGTIRVLNGGEPYGSCVYRSARDSKAYFFVSHQTGLVEQYALEDAGGGKITGRKVRELRLGSVVEGAVADHELGHLYLAQEDAGIWKLGAEPDAGDARKLIAKVRDHGLAADVEGLTIYYATQGRGYLIASSQGNHTFKVFTRDADNRFLLTIDPRSGRRMDDVSDTDGICVTSCPTSRAFPKGVFIAQDGENAGGHQNFKLYPWEEIAGATLLIDTNWSPRAMGLK